MRFSSSQVRIAFIAPTSASSRMRVLTENMSSLLVGLSGAVPQGAKSVPVALPCVSAPAVASKNPAIATSVKIIEDRYGHVTPLWELGGATFLPASRNGRHTAQFRPRRRRVRGGARAATTQHDMT